MDLASFVPGIGPTAPFTPGSNTPPPFNVQHTGLTDGTGPATASKNMAEIYNRVLLEIRAVTVAAGLAIDNNNWTQLQVAIKKIASESSAGTIGQVTTPPQFDNSTKIATTEFVNRALGSVPGVAEIFSSTTIQGSAAGWVGYVNTPNITVTLDAASFPTGSVITLIGGFALHSRATIVTNSGHFAGGLQEFNAPINQSTIYLRGFTQLQLVKAGLNWVPMDNGAFASQWGASNIQGSEGLAFASESGVCFMAGQDFASIGETYRTIMFPVAFPTGPWSILLTSLNPNYDAGLHSTPQLVSSTAGNFTYYNQGMGSGVANRGISWLAIGL